MTIEYTKEELSEFDKLVSMTESRNQVTRINGRFGLTKFIADHGKEKCDAMWLEIKDK